MTRPPGTIIVGASLAGFATAEALRQRGFVGSITLIGDEPHLPYSRPALTKQVLSGAWTREQAAIVSDDRLDALDVRFLSGRRVTSVDLARRTVVAGTDHLGFETLIAATGVTPRPLPGIRSARTVRTIDDVTALRRDFGKASRVVVIGAGVLGCELAAAARVAGLHVTLVGRGPGVGIGSIGGMLRPRPEDLLAREGVDLRLGSIVTASHETGSETVLTLSDGTDVSADLVLAAVGSSPATSWLEGNGLDLSDGVLCDAAGRAADALFAVGDVARWRNPVTGQARRIEHQSNAIDQANAVAEFVTTGAVGIPPHSFFWTELFGIRIQAVGNFPREAELDFVTGAGNEERFVATVRNDDGVHGVIGWNMAREFRAARVLLPDPPSPRLDAPLHGASRAIPSRKGTALL